MASVPDILAAAIVVLLATVLFVAALVVVAGGAWVWMNAVAAAHRARAHGLTANADEVTTTKAVDALQEFNNRQPPPWDPSPSDDAIREQIMADRKAAAMRNSAPEFDEGKEYTTLGNDGFEVEPPIPAGGMYADL